MILAEERTTDGERLHILEARCLAMPLTCSSRRRAAAKRKKLKLVGRGPTSSEEEEEEEPEEDSTLAAPGRSRSQGRRGAGGCMGAARVEKRIR